MTMPEVIDSIADKNQKFGFILNPPATADEISCFETKIGFVLPDDFKEFYTYCNGFECSDDIFHFLPLQTIIENADYGENWFHFSEYMIYSDKWTLKKNADTYRIVNINNKEIVLTTSLMEFLHHFWVGNVFEDGGLYEWQEILSKTLDSCSPNHQKVIATSSRFFPNHLLKFGKARAFLIQFIRKLLSDRY